MLNINNKTTINFDKMSVYIIIFNNTLAIDSSRRNFARSTDMLISIFRNRKFYIYLEGRFQSISKLPMKYINTHYYQILNTLQRRVYVTNCLYILWILYNIQ